MTEDDRGSKAGAASLPPISSEAAAVDDLVPRAGSAEAKAAERAQRLVDISSSVVRYRQTAVWALVVLMLLLGAVLWSTAYTYREALLASIQCSSAHCRPEAPPSPNSVAATASPTAKIDTPASAAAASPAPSADAASAASAPSSTGGGRARAEPPWAVLPHGPSTTFVALVAVLVSALTVLAITLLKATFTSPEARPGSKETPLPDGLPVIEVLRVLRDMADTILRTGKPK